MHQFVNLLVANPKSQIKKGDQLPESPCFPYNGKDDPIQTTLRGFIGDKSVVVITVPGPFTPVCSTEHIPPFLSLISEINKLGYEIIILSTSSPDAMYAWGETFLEKPKTGVTFLATDADAPYQMGIGVGEHEGSGLGYFFQRGVVFLKNGVVQDFFLETNSCLVTATAADKTFAALKLFAQ